MSSGGSGNFLLVPIPEYPLLDCVPNKTVKIAVLGASSVGKTALIVRFLTKRFIGDYEANTGALYSRKVTLDVEEVSLQIQDTPCVSLQVGNKSDLLRARQVPAEEGETLAASLGDPIVRLRERGEASRGTALGPTQVSEHAGAEEEVQTSAVVQSQIGHDALTKWYERTETGSNRRDAICAGWKTSREMRRNGLLRRCSLVIWQSAIS
uniref:small monomeric GTPase n=1 Tax=Neogobius melanostomus TaxID=47308 RepID=A0A8C6TMW2_9GOBI